MFVKSAEVAVEASQAFITERSVPVAFARMQTIYSVLRRLCPIFQVSNVTGEGLDLVSIVIAYSTGFILT